VVRIGLISDTHIPATMSKLPEQVKEVFHQVDLILHAGDLDILEVLDWLGDIAPVLVARGYGDPAPPQESRIKLRHMLKVGNLTIGLIHNLGFPTTPIRISDRLIFPPVPLAPVLERTFGSAVDVVVFGDSHEPAIVRHQGILFVNPGSATIPSLTRKESPLGTLGLLEIGENTAFAHLISRQL